MLWYRFPRQDLRMNDDVDKDILASDLGIAHQIHQKITLMSMKHPQVAAVLSNETDCADVVSTQYILMIYGGRGRFWFSSI